VISHIHHKLGTAGFIISIVALVAALGGGAYAASGGLNGKQKKEVEKIAKKYSGKPGAPGVAGAQGSAGAKGDTGAPGAAGANGSGEKGEKGDPGERGEQGDPGAIPNIITLAPGNGEHCEAGGTEISNANGQKGFACNGESGTGGGGEFPEALPSGATETGLWEVLGEKGIVGESGGLKLALVAISYPIRLSAPPIETLLVNATTASQEEKDKCPGTPAEPEASAAGVLCLYNNGNLAGEPLTLLVGGNAKAGAELIFAEPEKAVGIGSWAIKAP
jgi:hypothetical protein